VNFIPISVTFFGEETYRVSSSSVTSDPCWRLTQSTTATSSGEQPAAATKSARTSSAGSPVETTIPRSAAFPRISNESWYLPVIGGPATRTLCPAWISSTETGVSPSIPTIRSRTPKTLVHIPNTQSTGFVSFSPAASKFRGRSRRQPPPTATLPSHVHTGAPTDVLDRTLTEPCPPTVHCVVTVLDCAKIRDKRSAARIRTDTLACRRP